VVGILAALGGRGVTVVLSIHQPRPDVLRLMDRALILSGVGEVVYSGNDRRFRSQPVCLVRSEPVVSAENRVW